MGIFDKLFKNKKDIDKKNIEETPPIFKFNNETLRIVVKLWLEDNKKAEAKYGHISNWDTSDVTDMSKLFLDAHTFNENLNNWDVSKVTNMHAMFDNAYEFNQPLNNWDVSNVTNMSEMFSSAETLAFNQPLDNWDVIKVTDMSYMFKDAISFNQPLNNWDVSNVTDMSCMFYKATSFNQPLNNWDVSSVIDMKGMFGGAEAFNQPIENWDVSNVIDMKSMFRAGIFNQPIGNWDVSNVTDMVNMFNTATAFNQPIGNWDVSNVTIMSGMFCRATAFNLPLNNWDVSNVTDMSCMFYKATSFNQPLNNWDVSSVIDMKGMFGGAEAFNQPIGNWNVSNVIDMRAMFKEAFHFNQPIGNWSVSSVADFEVFSEYAPLSETNKPNFSESETKKKIKKSKFLEITNKEICNLKDEETYLDKDEKPFTGILFSKATTDEGRIQCEYKNGKRHGEYIAFNSEDENKISHTKYYKNGLLHGKDTYWYEKFKDGKKPAEEEKNLFEDHPEMASMVQQMTKKHDVMVQINYNDGLLHGKFTDYNWNGGINYELNFKEGKKDGVWRLYFETLMGTGQGALKKISIYKDDKHISSKYYNLDNEELSKEDALSDEEWGGEGWEDDADFSDWNHKRI